MQEIWRRTRSSSIDQIGHLTAHAPFLTNSLYSIFLAIMPSQLASTSRRTDWRKRSGRQVMSPPSRFVRASRLVRMLQTPATMDELSKASSQLSRPTQPVHRSTAQVSMPLPMVQLLTLISNSGKSPAPKSAPSAAASGARLAAGARMTTACSVRLTGVAASFLSRAAGTGIGSTVAAQYCFLHCRYW